MLGLVPAVALAIAATGAPVVAAGASLQVSPATIAVPSGATFVVTIVQDAPGATSGAEVTVRFDPNILQVVSVRPGSAYAAAPIVLPKDMDGAIREANVSGRLATIAAAFTPPDSVPAGPAEFLLIGFRVAGCGKTALRLPVGPVDGSMISGTRESYGDAVPVTTADGQVTTCVSPSLATPGLAVPAAAGPPLVLLGAFGLVALVLLGGLFAWRSRRRLRLHGLVE